MLLTSSDTKRTLANTKRTCIFSCFQSLPRENWFQYVRRLYETAINFPCIITLDYIKKVTTDGINNDTSKITNDGKPIDNNNDDNIIVFI